MPLAPHGAVQVHALAIDGVPITAGGLVVGAGSAFSGDRSRIAVDGIRAGVERLAVPAATVSGEPRVALQIVRAAPPPSLRIDETTRQQLRALGYAE